MMTHNRKCFPLFSVALFLFAVLSSCSYGVEKPGGVGVRLHQTDSQYDGQPTIWIEASTDSCVGGVPLDVEAERTEQTLVLTVIGFDKGGDCEAAEEGYAVHNELVDLDWLDSEEKAIIIVLGEEENSFSISTEGDRIVLEEISAGNALTLCSEGRCVLVL